MNRAKYIYSIYGTNKADKFHALYGVFRRNLTTGLIEGYIEKPFSMGWSPWAVKLLTLETANYYIANHFKHIDRSKYEIFIYRLTRKGNNRTIVADFKSRLQLFKQNNNILPKYGWQNIKFTTNGGRITY